MATSSKAVHVDLGAQRALLDRRPKSGLYEDESDVRHALRALEREDAVLDEILREDVKTAMADKRPSVPAATVFKRLEAHHRRALKKAGKRGA